ncbi:cucumisin-like [Malus domestica]|uniref:cucumisin-like n=1 Tax=Malus domestica TaxID=3750 RepID=UPI0039747B84
MSTAHVLDSKKHEDLEFAYGSGHINPLKAVNPSLIFDASEADHINFLCKQGYNSSILNIITGDNSSCGSTKPGKAWDLNYPSFSLQLEDGRAINAEFPRTVTDVGSTNSTYTISFYTPSDAITISVSPTTLSFSSIGEEKSFIVKVTGPRTSNQPITSGSVVLSDGSHVVRTPLVVYTYFPRSISALPLGLRKN